MVYLCSAFVRTEWIIQLVYVVSQKKQLVYFSVVFKVKIVKDNTES